MALARMRSGSILFLTGLGFLAVGCATKGDLQALRGEMTNQLGVMGAEIAQSKQTVDSLRTDVTLLKALGVAVETVKGRLDHMQATLQALQSEAESHRTALGNLRGDFREFKVAHEGVARETDRLRASVGSIEQGMIHQLQVEVNLSRERIKQLEQVIDSLQKGPPAPKEGGAVPKL